MMQGVLFRLAGVVGRRHDLPVAGHHSPTGTSPSAAALRASSSAAPISSKSVMRSPFILRQIPADYSLYAVPSPAIRGQCAAGWFPAAPQHQRIGDSGRSAVLHRKQRRLHAHCRPGSQRLQQPLHRAPEHQFLSQRSRRAVQRKALPGCTQRQGGTDGRQRPSAGRYASAQPKAASRAAVRFCGLCMALPPFCLAYLITAAVERASILRSAAPNVAQPIDFARRVLV